MTYVVCPFLLCLQCLLARWLWGHMKSDKCVIIMVKCWHIRALIKTSLNGNIELKHVDSHVAMVLTKSIENTRSHARFINPHFKAILYINLKANTIFVYSSLAEQVQKFFDILLNILSRALCGFTLKYICWNISFFSIYR